MGFFNIFKGKANTEERANPFVGATYFNSIDGSLNLGGTLTEDQAYTLPTYAAGIELISGTIASSPIHIKQRTDNGFVEDINHPLFPLFDGLANSDMLWLIVAEVLVRNALNHGNGYAYIEKDALTSEVKALWPIHPQCVRLVPQESGMTVYVVNTPSKQYQLRPDEIIHVKGKGCNGYLGRSTLSDNTSSIRFGTAAQTFGERFYSKGTNLGGLLKTTLDLTPEARQEMVSSFRSGFSGANNSFNVGILPKGIEFDPIKVNAADAQYVETRKFQDLQIARMLGIPPAMLGIIESGDKNTEQQGLNFFKTTLLPWFSRIEKELEAKLLKTSERGIYQIRFNADAVLRASLKERYEAYNLGIQWGYLSRNEVRLTEGKAAVDGLDDYLQPLNMTAVGAAPGGAKGANGDATAARSAEQWAETNAEEPKAPQTEPQSLTERNGGEAAETATQPPTPTVDLSAIRPILRAQLERLLTKETKAIGSALRRLEAADFSQWADLFYRDHQALAHEALEPIVETLSKLGRATPKADDLAAKYVAEQRKMLPKTELEIEAWRTAQADYLLETMLKSLGDTKCQ